MKIYFSLTPRRRHGCEWRAAPERKSFHHQERRRNGRYRVKGGWEEWEGQMKWVWWCGRDEERWLRFVTSWKQKERNKRKIKERWAAEPAERPDPTDSDRLFFLCRLLISPSLSSTPPPPLCLSSPAYLIRIHLFPDHSCHRTTNYLICLHPPLTSLRSLSQSPPSLPLLLLQPSPHLPLYAVSLISPPLLAFPFTPPLPAALQLRLFIPPDQFLCDLFSKKRNC